MNLYKKDNEFFLGLFNDGKLNKPMKANDTDAAVEKHKPAYKLEGDTIRVTVGDVIHPYTEEHYIDFVVLETTKGYQVKKLDNTKEPVCSFKIVDEEPLCLYAYCNKHGLWKTEIK